MGSVLSSDHSATTNASSLSDVESLTIALTEAREQQAAATAVLKVIGRSSFDLTSVLQSLVDVAANLSGARFGGIFLLDGNVLRGCASVSERPDDWDITSPLPLDRKYISGRVALTGKPHCIPDIENDPDYDVTGLRGVTDSRSLIAVPLLHDDEVQGVFFLGRPEVDGFTVRHQQLIETLADHATIAIRNSQLLQEIAQRSKELEVTSNVLQVISQSPTDTEPVFEAIAHGAALLCSARYSFVYQFDGSLLHFVAQHGLPSDVETSLLKAFPMVPGRATAGARAVLSGQVEQIPDIHADPEFIHQTEAALIQSKSVIGVPMLRNGQPIGAIAVDRSITGSFPERQIELLKAFADQAVIAIENARLFSEVRQSNKDLREALEQQIATGTILRAIASSPTDIQPVLDSVSESAAKLCGAHDAIIFLLDQNRLVLKSHYGDLPKHDHDAGLPVNRQWVTGRAVIDGKVIHVLDILSVPDEFPEGRELALQFGHRTTLAVPLLREGEALGAILIRRLEIKAFDDRQIDMLKIFADQAVIAIANAQLFDQVQQRNHQLQEALDYQTATANVLNVISRSPSQVQPVLDTIVSVAGNLCDAEHAYIFMRQSDGKYHVAASHLSGSELFEFLKTTPIIANQFSATGRAVLERRPVHIPDVLADPDYKLDDGWVDLSGIQTYLSVPLLRNGEPIGAITAGRKQPLPFLSRQIELISTFADQAVIAIENARLFQEVQARTREVSEALQQQTATAEVLKAISNSAFDLDTVLETLVKSASELCRASFGIICLRDGRFFRPVQQVGFPPEFYQFMQENPFQAGMDSVTGRVGLTGGIVHIPDVLEDSCYSYSEGQRIGGYRAVLGVPLLSKGEIKGAFALGRSDPIPFSPREIELVQTFADQAVIALENVRLFEEVQARTYELQQSLDHQTATSDVLNVISRSPTAVAPVLEKIVHIAGRLCEADYAMIFRLQDGLCHLAAASNAESDFVRHALENPIPPDRGAVIGRTILERKAVHIADCLTDPEYTFSSYQAVGKYRSLLGVPLLRNGEPIGAIGLMRVAVQPYTEKQIDLVTTFADQAVIAIENARLFEEVEARTRDLAQSVGELQALGEISQAVNSSLELKTVLETIVAKAVQLSKADAGTIYVYDGVEDQFDVRATFGMAPALIEVISKQRITLGDPGVGDAARLRKPIETPDLSEGTPSPVQKIVLDAGFRGVLVVPLLSPDKVVGALVVRRTKPGHFEQGTIQLMETFAAHSVLAIQNARLFTEIEEKSRQVEVASRHKSQFLANMSHELRTPLNSVLGFTEMLVDGLYGELPEKAKTALSRIEINGRHLLGLINDVLDLSKIEAGQLQLTIDNYSVAQIVKAAVVAAESQAKAKGLELVVTIADGLSMGRGDERRLTQVLINLIGNAVKFTDTGLVEVVALSANHRFEISVRDTGPGIPREHQNRIFDEFQQVDDSNTRKKGGSGLGLAISKRIIEMHGGTISVQSKPGFGATFRVTVPIIAAAEAISQ